MQRRSGWHRHQRNRNSCVINGSGINAEASKRHGVSAMASIWQNGESINVNNGG